MLSIGYIVYKSVFAWFTSEKLVKSNREKTFTVGRSFLTTEKRIFKGKILTIKLEKNSRYEWKVKIIVVIHEIIFF